MTDWNAEAREVAWRRALRANVPEAPCYTEPDRPEFFLYLDVIAEVADIAALASRAEREGVKWAATEICAECAQGRTPTGDGWHEGDAGATLPCRVPAAIRREIEEPTPSRRACIYPRGG